MQRTRKNEAGFTLLDVLVANSILLIAVLGLCGATTKAHGVQATLQERVAIDRALDEELTQIEGSAFDNLVADHDGRSFEVRLNDGANSILRTLPGDADGVVGSVSVRAAEPYNDPDRLLEVEVRVDARGKAEWHRSRTVRISRGGSS